MRLNSWQWIGIALSIAWAIGAAINQRDSDFESANSFATWAYESCVRSKASQKDGDLSNCSKERDEALRVSLNGSWGNVAFTSLVPIPLCWLAVFILLNVYRAQIIGFRAVVPWATLPLPKKAFVAFSVLTSLVVIVFVLLVALNSYTDAQVPVALSPFVSVTEGGNSLVQAKGTWIQEGNRTASKFDTPLQTSSITCYREQGRCLEARASVSTFALNSLMADLVEYEIESWSDTTIVFKEDSLCPATIFTIDRKTKTVNGVKYSPKEFDAYCKDFYSSSRENVTLRLANGYNVYREEKKKARPLLLRLIQTMFGN